MKKRALRKDFYMEIRRSLGRFLSIFFIVAIGCAFFSGIRASEPDMRFSGDAYFDSKNLMDVQVVSTLGLTQEDLEAIRDVDGIVYAEGGYSVDALCADGENQAVVHVMSISDKINQLQLESGTLPSGMDECVVDADYLAEQQIEIGDQIVLASGTQGGITETLCTDTFTVTGAVSSPLYISFQRGNTTIGNGSVTAFVCVPRESFLLDVYTQIDAQVDGARELTAFTDGYDDLVEEIKGRVEAIRQEREDSRYEEIKETALSEIQDVRKELDEGETALANAQEELEKSRVEAQEELSRAKEELISAQGKIDKGRTDIENSEKQLVSSRSELETSRQELLEGQQALDKGQADLNDQIAVLNEQIDNLNSLKEQYDALVSSGKTDEETQITLEMLYNEIQNGEVQISQAQDQIDRAKADLSASQDEINEGWRRLEEGEAQVQAAQEQIDSGRYQLADSQSQVDAGWQEYRQAQEKADSELASAEQKIQETRAELEEGWVELADAQQKVEELERPKWYVYDRSNLPDYDSYGDNADRMKAIGEVFPVIFFLVAALISLTTMTRMVEEQRTLIGTFKALGYERHLIAGKYLGYALAATVAGSIVGILVGEKIFPYIIINAYGIMFPYMEELSIPYNATYGLWAAGAALVCTMTATLLSCLSELKEPAAELMRPPTPKQGQRVLLERIPFFWKRLNFSWKASIRNLVRYKKRFLMTVFGIGGCMALMLVGFGLKDSIFAVVDIQYGEIQLYDGSIILEEEITPKEREALMSSLESDQNVSEAAQGLLTQVEIGQNGVQADVYLDVPENVDEFSRFVQLRSRIDREQYDLGDEGAVLTEKMASQLRVDAGDSIVIHDGERGDLTVKISAVCENYMGHYLYMSPQYYEKIYSEKPDYNCVFYRTLERTPAEAEEVGERALQEEGTLSISYTTDMRQRVDDMLGALDIVIVVLIMSAGMLAFVVLYNLNNINITERKRELATLKVLGFYNNEVSAYVYRENIVLTFLGALFGMVFGKVLHRFIIVTVEIENVMFGRNIDVSSFVYGFLLTFAFSLLVNGVMYLKLKKIDMVESLKSVE